MCCDRPVLLRLATLSFLLLAAQMLPFDPASTNAQSPDADDGAYPPPRAGQIANLSTRGLVETGDDVMISGFIVRDAPVQVIMRAIGPDLSFRGVAGALEDPMLRLFHDGEEIQGNDDWEETEDLGALIDSGLSPADPREAAILTTLEPGTYTGIVEDELGGSGIGLVEIFKAGGAGELTNISTRARVGTDDAVMVGGLILSGDLTTVVITAVGPDLAKRGVPGALQDPVLQLVRGKRIIAQNDDWVDSPQADFLRAHGLAPANPKESAIVATLYPGAYGGYTAVVHGAGGSSGVSLIEVNKLSETLRPVPPPSRPPRQLGR